ncbi:YraN family protein [candidate division KSB1 bacterium]|nr:YraN family protein [candidate division KSB1 bacterium]
MTASNNRARTGKKGEDEAAGYLSAKGYEILERNYHTREGEVDIIAKTGEILVFVEVKAGRQKDFGEPETWVDVKKQQKIGMAAESYLQLNNIENVDCRFDVVAIIFFNTTQQIKHIENAFWLE